MRRSSLSRRRHTPTVARRLRGGGKRGSKRRSQISVQKVRGGTIPDEMRGEELVGETIMLDVRQELIEKKVQADTDLKQAQEGVEKAQTAFKQARTAFEQAQEGVKQARTTFEQAQAAVDRPRSKYYVQKYDNATSTYTYIPEEDRSYPDPILFNAKKDEIHNNYSFVLR